MVITYVYFTCRKRKLDAGEPKNGEGPSKKIKTENGSGSSSSSSKSGSKEEELIKKQNKQMYRNRDLLESELKKADWLQILSHNKQGELHESGHKPVSANCSLLYVALHIFRITLKVGISKERLGLMS